MRLLEASEVGGEGVLRDGERGVGIEAFGPVVQALAQHRRIGLEVDESPRPASRLDESLVAVPTGALPEAEVDDDVTALPDQCREPLAQDGFRCL